MVSVKKIINEPKAQLIRLYDDVLENYLKDYDISRELFDVNKVKTNCDRVVLRRYYDSQLERANVLVLEDEFVGITYENLDTISDLLKENKLVKKM